MSKLAAAVLVCVSIGLIASDPVAAANRKAQDMVADFRTDQAALLAKFPALVKIDGVLRADCAAQNEGKPASGDFCGCASAVTTGLWRSGVDPKMLPRLTNYINNPTDEGANEFVRYQGPELYRSLCVKATSP